MSPRMAALLALVLGVLVAGCGGPGPEGSPSPPGGDEVQTHEVGPLLIRTAAAPGFVAQDLPNSGGGVSLVALSGATVNWMASQALLDRIVYASGSPPDLDIFVCNLDGSNRVRLTDNTAAQLSPCWSPDGAAIAFDRMWPAQDWEIMLMNADGTDIRALTANLHHDHYPSFAPEGRRLAFQSNRIGNDEIFAMYTDGSSATNLTSHIAPDGTPDWSPSMTTSRILFSTLRDGNAEIYEMAEDGSGATRMTDSAVPDQFPDYHPTRSRMAFQTAIQGNLEVAVLALGSTGVENLSATPGLQVQPCWSSDGRFVCYSSDVSGDNELVLQEADSPYAKYALTHNTAQDVSPDLGSPTLQTDRVIIGPNGSDWGGGDPVWTAAYGGIVAYDEAGYCGFVRIGVAATDADTLSISPLVQPAAPMIIGSGAVVGVVVEAREIVNLRQDAGRGRAPIAWDLGDPGPTALVIYLDAMRGGVVSVLVLRDSAYPAAAGSPVATVSQRVAGDRLVVEGDFGAVYNAQGGRVATEASRLTIDAQGGVTAQ